jgi:glucosamine-6-phosphate deaminase
VEIIIAPTPDEASLHGARYIAALVGSKPDAVLGLATGGTPVRMYEALSRLHRDEGLSFARCRTFNLDEYVGLGADHPASYRHFMQEHLFKNLDIPSANIHMPDGLAADVPAHCAAYEAGIAAVGGIDVQVLGVGSDGHIGFNEPSSSLGSRTRIKTLTARTRSDNARYFSPGEQVPHHVITMGIGTILDARSIVLLAFGAEKARAVAAMVEGPVTAIVPASALQWHPVVKVLLDEAAAGLLTRADYYRHVFANKPRWQRWERGGAGS